MHIVQVAKYSFLEVYGGIEQAVKNIAVYTHPLGCKHTILAVSPKAKQIQIDELGYATVVQFPISLDISSCPISAKMLTTFKNYLEQADVVHYHFPWPYTELLHLLFRIKTPSIVTYHSDIVRQKILKFFYAPLMRQFLSSVNEIVVTSPNYLETSADLSKFKAKCSVIPMGIDAGTYPVASAELKESWRSKLPAKFILFVGVLRYYKGLHILLEALAETQIPLVIVGAGPYEQELKQQAEQLKLTTVNFVGAVSEEDKVALLELCRAVILPSHLRSEALGLSLVEGLMFGKPLISAEIGTGTSFVNLNQVTGFVVPPNDPVALQKSMQRLLEDDVLAETMGQAARKRYEEDFTAQKMAQSYFQLYQKWNKQKG